VKTRNNRRDSGKPHNPHKDPHERIVRIIEKWDGRTRVFYAIRDYVLGYWRGTCELDEPNAWTRDLYKRAMFDTRREAREELTHIWCWREEKEEEALDAERLLNSIPHADDELTDADIDEIDHRGDEDFTRDLDDLIADMRKMAAVA